MKLPILLLGLVLAASTPESHRFLILGDSISQGGNPSVEKPWRAWLKEQTNSKVAYEFVGLLPGWNGFAGKGVCYQDTSYGDLHGAVCGATTESIHDWLLASEEHLRSNPAPTDIVIATGTNNIGVAGQSVDTAMAKLRAMTLDCHRLFPKAKIHLATVLRNRLYPVEIYNDSVRAMARGLARKKIPVQLLDWTTAVALSDLHDGLHPSPEGSRKMAGYLAQMLQGGLANSGGATFSPHLEPGAMDKIFRHGSHLSRRLRWRG